MKQEQNANRLSIPEIAGHGGAAATQDMGLPSPREAVRPLDRWLLHKMLEMIGYPPVPIVLWNGEEISVSDAPPVARVHLRDRRTLMRLVRNPNLNFGDDYSTGHIEVEGDLVRLLETINAAARRAVPDGLAKRLVWDWLNRPRSNSLTGSLDNIHHHYDIGNEFYRLWLDREMVYTCAYFPTPEATLEQAQVAKMHHVCRKLSLRPGDSVVEAGCGWGSLALHMARHYGVTVKAYNISHEQVAYARERAKTEDLQDRVEYIEDDYRNIKGTFDVFVSVGMLEHVGVNHYPELGGMVNRCLKDKGRGLIHSIGRNKPCLMNAWIEKRIFPGAYPPTLRELMHILEPWELCVLDVENLRLHYARTLEHWLERFNAAEQRVLEMFDRAFVRAWRLYLAGSVAAFRQSSLELFQIVFTRPAHDDIPWTRAYLYADQPSGA